MLSAAVNHRKSIGHAGRRRKEQTWTLDQVLLATRGRILALPVEKFGKKRGKGSPISLSGISFQKISTDTRTISPGDLFLALVGENFDGIDFIPEAIRKGAVGLVVNSSKCDAVLDMIRAQPMPDICRILPVVLVDDTLTALGDLAAYRRSLMQNLRVLAITGSSGKTTVKEMAASIISRKFSTLKTQGNFNNLVGLPLTLLKVEDHHQVAVLEMGMNQPGEIARLTEIADPDVGIIINIHQAHLSGLKNIAGVAKAKEELFANSKSWSTLVVNNDDPLVRTMAKVYRQRKISFAATPLGRRHFGTLRATRIKNLGQAGMIFTLHIGRERARVQLRAVGPHNVGNGLAAAALAHAAGMNIKEIAAGLQAFHGYDKRAQILPHPLLGLRIINDAYNANPASMQAAIETLSSLKEDRRAVAVLGDMLELGDYSMEAHQALGRSIARADIEYLAAVGEYGNAVVEAAQAAGMAADRARAFPGKKEIVSWLTKLTQSGALTPGDWLLLKGSRSMRMETLINDLADEEN
jgi:UDP-N-acetylmuramoyl-tripeptide--D-alanyl-D-alanine ligase